MVNLKGDTMTIFLIFVGLILVTTIIVPISDQVFAQSNTITVTNATVTALAINVSLDVQGRTLLTVSNVSEAINVSNVSNGMFLQTGISTTTGLESVQLFLNDTAADFVGVEINLSYTAEPDGYARDAGTRSITILITLFAALAALIYVIVVLFGGTLGRLIKEN